MSLLFQHTPDSGNDLPLAVLFLRRRRWLGRDFGENDPTSHFLEFLLELLKTLFDLLGFLLQFLPAMAQAFDFLVGGVFRHGQMQGRQKRSVVGILTLASGIARRAKLSSDCPETKR